MLIKHLSNCSSVNEVLNVLKKDAVVIIDDLVSEDIVKQVSQELKPYLEKTNNGKSEFSGLSTKRIGALMARSAASRELAINPLILEILDATLLKIFHFEKIVVVIKSITAVQRQR